LRRALTVVAVIGAYLEQSYDEAGPEALPARGTAATGAEPGAVLNR